MRTWCLVFCFFLGLTWSVGYGESERKSAENSEILENSCQQDRKKFMFFLQSEVKKINRKTTHLAQKILEDNGAYPGFLVQEASKKIREYNQDFESLCQKIHASCGKADSTSNRTNYFQQCQRKKDIMIEVQKTKLAYAIRHNTFRKVRSAIEEKIKSIAFKSLDAGIPIMSGLTQEANKLANQVQYLTAQPLE